MDISIGELTNVAEQIAETQNVLKDKVEAFDEKVNNLQKQITNLLEYMSNAPKNSLSSHIKEKTPQVQIPPTQHFFKRSLLGFCIANNWKISSNQQSMRKK